MLIGIHRFPCTSMSFNFILHVSWLSIRHWSTTMSLLLALTWGSYRKYNNILQYSLNDPFPLIFFQKSKVKQTTFRHQHPPSKKQMLHYGHQFGSHRPVFIIRILHLPTKSLEEMKELRTLQPSPCRHLKIQRIFKLIKNIWRIFW